MNVLRKWGGRESPKMGEGPELRKGEVTSKVSYSEVVGGR